MLGSRVEVRAAQSERSGWAIRFNDYLMMLGYCAAGNFRAVRQQTGDHGVKRIEQYGGEYDVEHIPKEHGCQKCTRNRAQCRRNLQEHADAQIGQMVTHIGRG